MKEVWYFVITFIGFYILYLLLVVLRKKGLYNFKSCTEVSFLQKKYSLDLENISLKSLANTVALANSFLVSGTLFIVSVIDNLIIKIIVAAGVMVPFILILYHFIGIYYRKKGKIKHV